LEKKITGFHCHTYGNITGDAVPILNSLVKRTNYKDDPREILSGVTNSQGNVVGLMVHGALDENPEFVNNILKFVDADDVDLSEILKANKTLSNKIKLEIGIETGINVKEKVTSSKIPSEPKMIMMGSTGSDSGKTFLTTGLVGVLRKRGYNVGVIKIGPDIRDIVPSLYLNKQQMEKFSSIQIGGLGWKDLRDVLEAVKSKNYDIVIVEGVMSIFTGMLNEKVPFSSAEIAMASNMPVLMVSPCNKGGIESAAVDLVAHVEMMKKLGIKVAGAILNKVYDKKIAADVSGYIESKIKPEYMALVRKVDLTERGNIPEVEIKLEDFCLNAIKTVEEHLDIDRIVNLASKPNFEGYKEFEEILDNF
jgi:cobyric acid synthase